MIEILVVIAIMALITLIAVPPRFTGSGVELKSAARDIAAGMRKSRDHAITRNVEAVLTIDVEQRRFMAADSLSKALPPKSTITLFTASDEMIDSASGNIRFFPDGSSTGGGLRIEDNGQAYKILVNWLTGQVMVEDAR